MNLEAIGERHLSELCSVDQGACGNLSVPVAQWLLWQPAAAETPNHSFKRTCLRQAA